jgi:DNA replication initiation complex subunit (GINS family)
MSDVNVNITYETLYEILRNEKNREDLQELSPSFYEDVIVYLNKNKKMLEDALLKNFSDDDKEDLTRQIRNIRNLIKEIYERREKKIFNMALGTSRSQSYMNTDLLLLQERELYKRLVDILNCFRDQLLNSTLSGSLPSVGGTTCTINVDIKHTHEEKDLEVKQENQELNTQETAPVASAAESTQEVEKLQATQSTKKMLKFKESVPKFLGKELEVYGPYEPEEIASLPNEVAMILLRKGKAEEIAE